MSTIMSRILANWSLEFLKWPAMKLMNDDLTSDFWVHYNKGDLVTKK